jgi:FKBP-type peptidyl-prolyl cis-trans isomerase FkpA
VTFRRAVVFFAFTLLPVALAACKATPTAPSTAAFSQTDLRVGTGGEATNGKTLTVHYTGWVHDPSKSDGKGLQFETSVGREPFSFVLGAGQVIAGWDQGLVGMRVGGIRRLVLPPSLAYGPARNGPIPPNASLVFEVELLSVPADPTQYRINLVSESGNFLTAEGNGHAGSVVVATRTSAGDWETFRLLDLNAGALESGDVVRIETTTGWGFVRTSAGTLGAQASPGEDFADEEFVIEGISGGAIGNGSQIALRARLSAVYVSAEGGGGGAVRVDRTSVGSWETFTLIIR